MVNQLIMPLANAGVGVQTDDRFCEEVRSRTASAEEIVARRAHGHIQKASIFIERHRRPHVGMPGELPGVLFPGVVSEFAWPRDRVEAPYLFSSPRVECANVS